MNSNKQAQKGFKTFILTLVVSLVVFSAIYYVINSGQQIEERSDRSAGSSFGVSREDSDAVETATLGEADERAFEVAENVAMGQEEEPEGEVSAFRELAKTSVGEVPQGQVLAGEATADTTMVATPTTADTTEVAQSTVPDTGISGPTLGIVLTLVILGFAAYIMFLGPRNIALYNFEKDVLDDLD
jgi:hypothetical protein